MIIDPAFDMPARNWGQQGSFLTPIFPPTNGPDGGTLVQLPCINKEWVLPLMGAIDQLRNPSTWNVLTDLDVDGLLSWVTKLQEMIWGSIDMGCCNVSMRLTSECGLQFSVDGGATWADVSGWSTNFCTCASNCLIPPVPPNPGPALPNQHACNIAGYIAQEIIKLAISDAVTAFNTSLSDLQYAQGVMNSIAWAFPITALAFDAFVALYGYYTSLTIAAFTSASTDPALWSSVTCAIYEAIKATGFVTSSNLPAVISNVCSVSYTSSAVINAICAFITNVGLKNIQTWQNAGAFDDVDCSGCGFWCEYFDFTASNQGWSDYSGTSTGVYVLGTGWESASAGGGLGAIDIKIDLPYGSSPAITEVDVLFTTDGSPLTTAEVCYITPTPFSQDCHAMTFFAAGGAGYQWDKATGFASGHTRLEIFMVHSGYTHQGQVIVAGVQLRGPGPNPYGLDNCVV